jgi:hypothetical protein
MQYRGKRRGFHSLALSDIVIRMQPLASVLAKINLGYATGVVDSSCYNRVGRVLRTRGETLTGAVIALYAAGRGSSFAHVAIETMDGVLIDERHSQPPPQAFRDATGRVTRADMTRHVICVSDVLDWLRAHAQ